MITTNTDRALRAAMIAAAIAVGCGLGVAVAVPTTEEIVPAVEQHDQTAVPLTYADLVSIATGTEPAEGEPAFDCRRHGSHVCAPGNPQGVPPGTYRETTATDLCGLMVPPIAEAAR